MKIQTKPLKRIAGILLKSISYLRQTHIKDAFINFIKYRLSDKVQLEISSYCQLKCPVCSQTLGNTGIIGKGYLSFNNFRNFIDKYPHIKRIEVSNYGEIFLNPQFKDILQYAFSNRIELAAYNGVNLNTVNIEILELLVSCQFRHLTVSLDGATAETYAIYRMGGNFETVISNIKKINSFKQSYQSTFPVLRWQFTVFGHNEHEISLAREKANELRMEFEVKRNWSESYSPVKNYKWPNKINVLPSGFCRQLWLSPQINWDGKIMGCCINKWNDFGNAFENDLNIRKNERLLYARKMLLGKTKEREDIPCAHCLVYHEMKNTKRYLKRPVFLN